MKRPNRVFSAARCGGAAILLLTLVGLGGCADPSSGGFTPIAAASDPPAYASNGGQARPANRQAIAAAAEKLTAAAMPGNSAYKIGPMDVLDISVFNVPDLSRTVQVAGDGTINYPLIGEVPAAGETAEQLESELERRLGAKYLRSPQVTVLIKHYNSQRVTVEGSVGRSGVYSLTGRTTLSQVLAMAGGVNDAVASGTVVVFRTIDGRRSAARFNIDAIMHGRANDPTLEPGDVIVADTSTTKVALHNILGVLPVASTSAMFVPLL